jgi:phosphoglycolate phosphatase-like HAD superfamily hydrolase
MSHLVLFDIDLTLIRLNAVGRAAMDAALLEMADIDDGLAGIDFAGRTDRWILRQALAGRHTPEDFETFLSDFDRRYLAHLEIQLPLLGGELLPGVTELLESLAAMPHVRLGVATGNLHSAAWLKLKAFGLDRYFEDGGFADDAEERADLVAVAIERLGGRVTGHDVLVVGDSPHDITAAKANDAIAVGVATGRSSIEQLRASGADLVVPDLVDSGPLLALLAQPDGDPDYPATTFASME